MNDGPTGTGAPTDPPSDADALRADIDETREQLRHTAQALSDKADVRKRAKTAASDAQERAKRAVVDARSRATDLPDTAASLWRTERDPILAGAATVVLGYLVWTYLENKR